MQLGASLAALRVPFDLTRLYECRDRGLITFARAVAQEVARMHEEARR